MTNPGRFHKRSHRGSQESSNALDVREKQKGEEATVSVLLKASPHAELSLAALYRPIADSLEQVEHILRKEMRSRYPYVDELVRYGAMLGGKRLRPALLLSTAKALGSVTQQHLILAAVVEMIHTATLVHDDVLDEAATRRHLATVNSRWDNQASVLLGDFLFTHAFYLASTLESTWACRAIGRATNIVCEGEIRQKGSMGDFTLSENDYIEIVSAKTAELCACCCELGARYAEAPEETIQAMASFGRNLGIAFQIADDILDVTGDEQATGKSLGTDLVQQKPTLPIIRLLDCLSGTERAEMISALQGPAEQRNEILTPALQHHNAISYARERAQHYAELARRQAESLEPSAARDTLVLMTRFVVARNR